MVDRHFKRLICTCTAYSALPVPAASGWPHHVQLKCQPQCHVLLLRYCQWTVDFSATGQLHSSRVPLTEVWCTQLHRRRTLPSDHHGTSRTVVGSLLAGLRRAYEPADLSMRDIFCEGNRVTCLRRMHSVKGP